MFSDASTPSSAGPSSEPAWMTSEPARMSSPAGRRCMPERIAPSTTIVPSSTVVSSCWAIASAPSGTGAPVEMRTVVPGSTTTPAAGAGLRLADELQPRRAAGGVGGDDRVAVHRRGVERRHVVRRARVVGERAAERVVERDVLGVEHR